MILAKGKFDTGYLLDSIIRMAEDKNERHEENRDKPYTHAHGWGIVFLQEGKLRSYKSRLPVFSDSKLESFRNLKTSFLVLHSRRASRGVVAPENTHPFFQLKNGIEFGFCHNGTVYQNLEYNPGYRPAGNTDSEIFFLHILSALDLTEPVLSLSRIIKKIGDYSALNSFLFNRNYAIVLNQFTRTPEYYTMKISTDSDSIIISSESLPGNKNYTWVPLSDRTIVKIDLTSAENYYWKYLWE